MSFIHTRVWIYAGPCTLTNTNSKTSINYNHSHCARVYGLLMGSDRGCGDVVITLGFLPFPTLPLRLPTPVELDISIFVTWSPVTL